MQTRRAITTDATPLAALINSAYRGDESRQGWTTEAELLDGVRTTEAEVIELVNTPNSQILIGLDSNEILACVHLQLVSDAAFLGMFCVRPRRQANGVGKTLMAEAERAVVRDWAATKMLMDVISVRAELIAFYERRGYRMTGKSSAFPVNDALWTPKMKNMQLMRMEKLLPA
jgi:ribosomal protein S18 acetylase RimI-like enzyme